MPEYRPSRRWPMVGMLALGLVAGVAIGGYAVSQRSHVKRLAGYIHGVGDEVAAAAELDDHPVVVTTHRSNHRRKATSEV